MDNEMPIAFNVTNLCEDIYEAITKSKHSKYAPDALFRVFVYIAKQNEWTLERCKEEAEKGIRYYFENTPN